MSAAETELAVQEVPITHITRGRGPVLRPTVFTKKKKKRFLQSLYATGGNVSRACELARVSKPTVYHHRDVDQEFRQMWDETHEAAFESLEEEIHRRAKNGIDEPVFYKGNQVGQVKRYSDVLAMFILKAHRPEKYRENIKIESELSPQSVEAIGNSLAQALIKAAAARRLQSIETTALSPSSD